MRRILAIIILAVCAAAHGVTTGTLLMSSYTTKQNQSIPQITVTSGTVDNSGIQVGPEWLIRRDDIRGINGITTSTQGTRGVNISGSGFQPANEGITTVTLNSLSPVMLAKSAPNNAVISIAANAFLTSQSVTAGQSMTVTPSLTGVRVATTADPGGYGITTTSITGTGAATVTPSAPNVVVVNVPTGAGLTTPSLQQVTVIGQTSNRDVVLHSSETTSLTLSNFGFQTTGTGISGSVIGSLRGPGATDLQSDRQLSSEVASGGGSVVSGGSNNTAFGTLSTVSGGTGNSSIGSKASTVGGGELNTASGTDSVVSGGQSNTASGDQSSVGGGVANVASNALSCVSGGDSNTASGEQSAVCGGNYNVASVANSSTIGGTGNMAVGQYANVSGGLYNWAAGEASWVTGEGNYANNDYESIVGSFNSTSTANLLFVVANGSDGGTRSNAFTVDNAGHLQVASNVLVNNLNADLWRGYTPAAFTPSNYGITTTSLQTVSPLMNTKSSPNNVTLLIDPAAYLTTTSIIAGTNVTVTPSGNTVTIASATASTPSWQAVTNVGNTTTQNVGTTGTFTASGNMLGGRNITAAGIVRGSELSTSYTVTASGNIQSGNNMTAAGIVRGSELATSYTVTASGNVQSGNNIKASGIVTGNNGLATSGPLSVSGQAQFSGGIALTGSGGTNQVVKQASTGAAFTVGTLASTNLSDTANIPLLNVANTFTAVPNIFKSPNNTGSTEIVRAVSNNGAQYISLLYYALLGSFDLTLNTAGGSQPINLQVDGTTRFQVTSTGIDINSGAVITGHLTGTGASGILSITNIADSSFTITVTGAATGDTVVLGAPSTLEANVIGFGFVSAANTVTVRLSTGVIAGVTIASATWRADAWHH